MNKHGNGGKKGWVENCEKRMNLVLQNQVLNTQLEHGFWITLHSDLIPLRASKHILMKEKHMGEIVS